MTATDNSLLRATFFLDSEHDAIKKFTRQVTSDAASDGQRATALFAAVRDEIRYNPYSISQEPADYRASSVLTGGANWCVPKAVLLAATARAAGIPCRLGFADVRNHLSTPKLQALMGTDLFVYHGYVEWLVEGTWNKVTPAFNSELCARSGVSPLEFEVGHDALMHEFAGDGHQYMQYVRDRGTFIDLPLEEILTAIRTTYQGRVIGLMNHTGEEF